jgi:hypothetical protein
MDGTGGHNVQQDEPRSKQPYITCSCSFGKSRSKMMMTKMGHEYKGDFLQDGEEEQKAY